MPQQTWINKLCQLHKNSIISLCFNPNCNKNRLVCFDCFKDELHFEHQNYFIECKHLERKLNQSRSKYDCLIPKLSKIIDEIPCLYQRLKKGINYKFNISINKINNDQINQYININSLLKFLEQIEYLCDRITIIINQNYLLF